MSRVNCVSFVNCWENSKCIDVYKINIFILIHLLSLLVVVYARFTYPYLTPCTSPKKLERTVFSHYELPHTPSVFAHSHTTEKVKAFFSLSPYASFIYRCSMDSTSSQVNALKTHAHCDCTTFYLIWCLCAQNYLLSVFPAPRFPEKRCLGFMSRITLSPSPFLAWWLRSFCAFLAIFFTFATICTEKIMVKPLQLCHYLIDEHRKLCFCCTLKHLDLWHHL